MSLVGKDTRKTGKLGVETKKATLRVSKVDKKKKTVTVSSHNLHVQAHQAAVGSLFKQVYSQGLASGLPNWSVFPDEPRRPRRKKPTTTEQLDSWLANPVWPPPWEQK